jgi:hypothetical protein
LNKNDLKKEIEMKTFRAWKAAKVLLCIVVVVAIAGFVVKGLWNALMPQIFGLHSLTFWQALGLLLLTKLLFGGFHRHSGGAKGRWRNQMRERWEKMSPEERERFREGMRCGRGPFGRPAQS